MRHNVKNPFKDKQYRLYSDGRVCILEWKNRHGPVPLLLAGAGLQAYGQYQAGEEANAVAKYNQQVKEREAQAAEQQSLVQSRKQAQAAARQMSELQAGLGASGAVTTAGAPLSIISEQAQQSELENLEIGYEGLQEASKLREEGKMIRREGKTARRAARIQAGASLLTGFGTAGLA
jgi:hypothetical protein